MTLALLTSLVPDGPDSVARVLTATAGTSVAMMRWRRHRGGDAPVGQPAARELADRIRARMAETPDVIPMSDELVERIAGVLSPVPLDVRQPAEAGSR
jgi:hypothetical protein